MDTILATMTGRFWGEQLDQNGPNLYLSLPVSLHLCVLQQRFVWRRLLQNACMGCMVHYYVQYYWFGHKSRKYDQMANGVFSCVNQWNPRFSVEVHAKRHPSVSQGEGFEGFEGAMSPEYERLGRLRAELARQGWWGPVHGVQRC